MHFFYFKTVVVHSQGLLLAIWKNIQSQPSNSAIL